MSKTQEQNSLNIGFCLRRRSSQDGRGARCPSWHTYPRHYTGHVSVSAGSRTLCTCHVSPLPPDTCHTCTDGQQPRRIRRIEDTWEFGWRRKIFIFLGVCESVYLPVISLLFSVMRKHVVSVFWFPRFDIGKLTDEHRYSKFVRSNKINLIFLFSLIWKDCNTRKKWIYFSKSFLFIRSRSQYCSLHCHNCNPRDVSWRTSNMIKQALRRS